MLVVKDGDGRVFGCFTPCSWRIDSEIYGTEQSFVFLFTAGSADYAASLEAFNATMQNTIFMATRRDGLSLGGGGDGAAISLDRQLNGSSYACETFGNSVLSTQSQFVSLNVEVWGLGWRTLPDINEGQPLGSFFTDRSSSTSDRVVATM